MENMMDSADARKFIDNIISSLLAHGRAVIDEEITYSDLHARVHPSKIMITIQAGSDGRDVWSIRNSIFDMHRMGIVAWPEMLKVRVEVSPRKMPYVTEMGKLRRWFKKMSVTE